MRIKEGDEWKAAFTMPEGSFEPTVMFFGLTNSLATFQAIMNELLRDLINTGKVAVLTETEEGHDELVAEVLEWPTPKCVKDVQKFLGLANYYCRFIENFVSIARPLHDMVKKDKKWDWTEKQEKAFKELKERFTKEPVLATPDIDKKMRMEVDALDYATGGVLSMECEDGLWRPVAFLSKSLNKTEQNYEIHDKEMLAIIRGLEA